MRLYGYADYSVTSVKAKRPYNHITLKLKKLNNLKTEEVEVCETSVIYKYIRNMKKIYIKPIIEVVEMDGDTILTGSPGRWKVVDQDGRVFIPYDYKESNAEPTGSLAKDFEFSFAEDFEYDF